MVVQNSVTFSVTQIGSQVGWSKALDYPGWTTPVGLQQHDGPAYV
jgi:hypothetical protein